MNYKSFDLGSRLDLLDVNSNADTLIHVNNRIYISKIGQNENYEPLDNYTSVIQAINDINKIISTIEIKKICVYKYLKTIDIILSKSPSPNPDDLATKFLPNLLRIISGSNEEDSKTLSLKIILYISLSTNEEITNLYDEDMIQLIIKYVSLKKPFISKSYIPNLIYSCAILNNILTCSKKNKNIYEICINNKLLHYLNDKLLSLSSYQEMQYVFILIIQLLKLSEENQNGIAQFDFLLPTLVKLLSNLTISQEKSLECLYIFMQDYECFQLCLSNDVPKTLYEIIINDNFKTVKIHRFMKCINIFCSDSLISPFDEDIFYEKIMNCIVSTGSNGIHEIFIFFLQVIKFDQTFNQNILIQIILDAIELKDCSYKTECINFFTTLILDSILKVSDELFDKIAIYILTTAYQMHEDCLNGCLHVIDNLLAKNNQLSEKILADPDFYDFLDECSSNDELDEECREISMMLSERYIK